VSPLELFPAIDLRGGRAVRLVQGDYGRERAFGDAVEMARRYVAAGAHWIHIVDLDAARTGDPVNRTTVLEIARSVDAAVQAGGGVRSEEDAAELLHGGVARVVVGTVAQEQPELLDRLAARFCGRVAVGLDHRRGGEEVAVRGWEQGGGESLRGALDRLAEVPLAAVVVTAIERDGTLSGPDVDGLAQVLGRSAHPVIASGGVRSGADLAALAALDVDGRRLAGAIVGIALADGSLSMEEAIAACAPSG
jgi:phosphoribosylformimino-5-aminoimidazole carboxamide ribotide isomerase